jgi:hypothetical protein
MDDEFLIGHADESGDVHARFPSPQPVGAMLPGFNRGNVDWFHAHALKRRIRSVEMGFGDTRNKRPNPATRECAMSRRERSPEALWKFPPAARERSPAAIIPRKWEAGWRSYELAFTSG